MLSMKGVLYLCRNAELHTHGFISADLGLGAILENTRILNSILGTEHYRLEENNNAFRFSLMILFLISFNKKSKAIHKKLIIEIGKEI